MMMGSRTTSSAESYRRSDEATIIPFEAQEDTTDKIVAIVVAEASLEVTPVSAAIASLASKLVVGHMSYSFVAVDTCMLGS
jgi:hypothetical protein